MPEDLLGGYLRARRGRLRPADVGLPAGGQRRVSGLRREEVALLAGISADYYLRLEQGRGGRPSEQVLRALAATLQLDATGTDYLLSLIGPHPAVVTAGEQVPESLLNFLRLLDLPAFVTGRNFDVLASNAAARLISPELAPGHNRLRSVFLVDAERALYRDWEAAARRFVGIVRDTVGRAATDPSFSSLVDELSSRSTRFRQLWARHEVVARDTEYASLRHPVAGDLRLHLERLDIAGMTGISLVVYHPEQGSADARRLAALLSGQPSPPY